MTGSPINPKETGAGHYFGQSTADKIGFYGTTPITQRTNSSQASLATTGAASSASVFGFTTAAQADAVVKLANEMRAALVAVGIIKGS